MRTTLRRILLWPAWALSALYVVLCAAIVAFLLFGWGYDAWAQEPPADAQLVNAEFGFSGKWLPDANPAKIGGDNYSDLRNFRYSGIGGEGSLRGTLGYSKITNTALTTHPYIRNGYQLWTNATGTNSNVLAWARNAAGTSSAVYLMQDMPPSSGDFQSTAIHTDAAGAGVGRFSRGPQGTALYANGKETRIWGGNETSVNAFYVTNSSLGGAKDYSEAVRNTLATAGNYAAIGGTHLQWLVMSSRALQGVYYDIKTANAAASTVSAAMWNGTAFQSVSGLSDGTSSGGVSLAQDGWMRFTSTVGTAKPYHYEGKYLYAYRFTLTAGTAQVSNIKVDAPWQPVGDVWDGVSRQCIGFFLYRSGVYEDYTLEINEPSTASAPLAALLGNATATDHAIVQFLDRQSAMKFTLLATLTNNSTAKLHIQYWNSTAWTSPTWQEDDTKSGAATLAQTGLVKWSPPDEGQEFPQTLFGTEAYAYKITWSGKLDDTTERDGLGTSVDLVTGVPAQKVVQAYKFASMYRGRTMLCNYEAGNEPERVDYSAPYTPDVYNGELSSDGGLYALRFGGSEPIVAASELYNQYGSRLYSIWVVFKEHEIHTLLGDGGITEDWEQHTASPNIGCVSPLTLDNAVYEIAPGVFRNCLMWLSNTGPALFDGVNVVMVEGVSSYFDPSKDTCVNREYIEESRGWFDSVYKEYNLLIPSGSTATTPNVWLVYDLVRKKWFRKDTGANPMLKSGWAVQNDKGSHLIYAGTDYGRIMLAENGTSWDGSAIERTVETGDIWLDNTSWHQTLVRRLRVVARRMTTDHLLSVSHIADSEDDGVGFTFSDTGGFSWTDWSGFTWTDSSLMTLDLSPESSLKTLVRDTEETNLLAWSHRFKFSLRTADTQDVELVGWGVQFRVVRDDR